MLNMSYQPARSRSERLYSVLLYLYPTAYRHAYGPLMAQLFRDLQRDASRTDPALGIARLWIRTLLDLVRTVSREQLAHARRYWMCDLGEIKNSSEKQRQMLWYLAAAVVLAAGVLGRSVAVKTFGSFPLAFAVIVMSCLIAILMMQFAFRRGWALFVGQLLVALSLIFPLLSIGDPEGWLRQNPPTVWLLLLYSWLGVRVTSDRALIMYALVFSSINWVALALVLGLGS